MLPYFRAYFTSYFFQVCVYRLLEKDSPSLDTVRMQVYFDMNYATRGDLLEEHKKLLESRLQVVVREITDSRARTREELDGNLTFC